MKTTQRRGKAPSRGAMKRRAKRASERWLFTRTGRYAYEASTRAAFRAFGMVRP
jgi:hypothetical protein